MAEEKTREVLLLGGCKDMALVDIPMSHDSYTVSVQPTKQFPDGMPDQHYFQFGMFDRIFVHSEMGHKRAAEIVQSILLDSQ